MPRPTRLAMPLLPLAAAALGLLAGCPTTTPTTTEPEVRVASKAEKGATPTPIRTVLPPSPSPTPSGGGVATPTPVTTPKPAGTTTPKPSSSAEPAALRVPVTIRNFTFTPSAIRVKKGGVVAFSNDDVANHSVKPDGHSGFTATATIAPGAIGTVELPTVGEFKFVCGFHGSMKGTITVVE